MHWYILDDQVAWQNGVGPKSKIWRLTGFGSGVLDFGPEFEVNFSGSAHLW